MDFFRDLLNGDDELLFFILVFVFLFGGSFINTQRENFEEADNHLILFFIIIFVLIFMDNDSLREEESLYYHDSPDL